MTLLITVIAAVICTVIWYANEKARKLKISTLCFMYWGASLMWLVDAVVEYLEAGAEFFAPAAADMLNDGFLGLSVVALGMIIWVITVIVKDPNGTVKAMLAKRQ
ncbi:MAG: hypothetical protein ACI4I1_03145 [Oscillospiraceae bacterium]